MNYSLNTNYRINRDRLPPSMQASGLECSRRLWLMHHHYTMAEALQWKEKTLTLQSHLDEEWKETWQFEIRLPSGTTIDAWITGEAVLIEFKTEQPDRKHLYQVWMMMEEAGDLGIKGMEFQLWYTVKYQKEAAELAVALGLGHGQNEAGLYAIALDGADSDFLHRRERDTAIMLGDLEREKPPAPKESGSRPCHACVYYEFCHC